MEDSFGTPSETAAPTAQQDHADSLPGSASPTITSSTAAGHFPDSHAPKGSLPPSPSSLPRQLPSRDITPSTIEDAYVQFIQFCNPCVSSLLPTVELRRGFNSVPRTDGKSFEVWTVFELVRRLEHGELGTWNALVLELGVERPDLSKGQSGQKVGQYGVRLKRWLHAYHIDAFFQYCLGRSHEYYTNIPNDPESATTVTRDNIPPEEDLALRALVPNLRPKRGRRKEDESAESTPNKRVRKSTPVVPEQRLPSQLVEQPPPAPRESSQPPPQTPPSSQLKALRSSYPQSALPAYNHEAYMADVWASAERAFIGTSSAAPPPPPPPNTMPQGYWGGLPRGTSPWPYPYSAIDPHPPPNPLSARDGSQSAHPLAQGTPEKSQRKRSERSVSAAWRSGSPSAAYKPNRGPGRPPLNRAVYDGPYATFPTRERDLKKTSHNVPVENPSASQTPGTPTPTSAPAQKPSKLSLQVPQHTGAPVRLATPPPKVMVNGGEAGGEQRAAAQAEQYGQNQDKERTSSGLFDEIDQASDTELEDNMEGEEGGVDWKRRALVLGRKLKQARAELKTVRRRVMEAVM